MSMQSEPGLNAVMSERRQLINLAYPSAVAYSGATLRIRRRRSFVR